MYALGATRGLADNYRTGCVGKWHLGDAIMAPRGFDHRVGSNDFHGSKYTYPESLDPARRVDGRAGFRARNMATEPLAASPAKIAKAME